MFTVEQVVSDHYPSLNQRTLCGPLIKSALRRLLHEHAFINFAEDYPHLHGIEFIEQVLDYFHFSFAVSSSERENIPPPGKHIKRIGDSLEGLETVIMFPAGEVSRFGLSGIKDCQWQRGISACQNQGGDRRFEVRLRYLPGLQ